LDFRNVTVDADKRYLLPIGDLHIGDRAFRKEGLPKLKANLEWLRQHEEHAFGFLMGDIFNVAGRNEKTDPFTSDPGEFAEAEDIFGPYADLFEGAVRGNHERRIVNSFGFDPLELFCKHLKIPYMGTMALLRVQVGRRPESEWYWNSYNIRVHHSTGGGGNVGNSLNTASKLEKIIPGCDAYLIGHNHQNATAVQSRYIPTASGPKLQKVHFVSCGSYLTYEGSYAEEAMLTPGKLGSPRIRLSGVRDHRDLHVSL
jgi:hypothetical protein